MKKKSRFFFFLSVIIGIMILFTFCKKDPGTHIYGSVDFIFRPDNSHTQFALWVEDWNGKYIRTIFLTSFIGRNGGGNRSGDPNIDLTTGNRLSALPVWCHKRDVIDNTFNIDSYYPPSEKQSSYPDDIDAVSGATPDNSIQKITWQLLEIPYGRYDCWIEANRSYDFNNYHNYSYYRGQPSVVWKTSVNITQKPDSSMILVYSGYGSPDGSNGALNAPDNTITTASNLLNDIGGYKFKVIYNPY